MTTLDRYILLAVVAGVPLFFAPSANDVSALPKATVVVVAAVVLIASRLGRLARDGTISVVRGPVVTAVASLVVAFVVTSVFSDALMRSLLGAYSRWAGVLVYLGYVVIAYAIATTFRESIRELAVAAAVGATLVTGYAVIQEVGLDPIEWVIPYEGRFATLGNPNFLAGYLAIVVSLVGYLAVTAGSPLSRVVWGVDLVWLGIGIVLSRSVQGPVAAVGGLSILMLALLKDRQIRWWKWGERAWLLTAIAASTVAIAGAIGVGPLAPYLLEVLEDRRWYWQTAGRMFVSSPVVGIGPGHYGLYYRTFRPFDAWEELGPSMSVSSAHSVPFEMFSVGGAVLGVAYLAVIAVTASALVTGLRRLGGGRLLAIGGFGGGWFAYQLQSLVSVDVPQLGVFHWVTGAAVVAIAGAVVVGDTTILRRRDALWRTAAAVAATVVLVVGLIFVTRPVRADLAVRSDVFRAVQLAPWESYYWLELGATAEAVGLTDNARKAYQRSVAADPRYWNALLDLTRLTARTGDMEQAVMLAERLLEIDSIAPFVRADTANLYLRIGRSEGAVDLLEYALSLEPDRADWWRSLGDAYDASGRSPDAERARARAEEIESA